MDSGSCELPMFNASDDEISRLLETARTIAVVGISSNPERDSYRVARYLKEAGFTVVPINPGASEVLGEPAYPDLTSVPASVQIDIVDIFRRPEHIPPIVDQAIERGAGAVWMQLGLANNAAAEKARAAGLTVVMDRCLKVEHARRAASS